ncbi:hypothetical protein TRVA0_001S05622 [Trichomonascus vanleenenianus]|uniref:uncharacterized protein n=1 Tax=Trichomonascus vanleenenianus TaxID=2268995 RepID=UPI003EC9C665
MLDEFDDIDEKDAGFILRNQPVLEITGTAVTGRHVLFVAPRLSHYADLIREKLGGQDVTQITGGVEVKETRHHSIAEDLYDNDYEAEKTVESQFTTPVISYGDEFVVVPLPKLELLECYNFSAKVVEYLRPSKVTLLCPSNMDASAKSYVYQLSAPDSTTLTLPYLAPPFALTGVSASIASKCQRDGIPFVAVIVRGEGPLNFEAIDHENSDAQVCQALNSLLNVNLQCRHSHESSSLYI